MSPVSRERVVLVAFAASALLAGGNSVAIRFTNRELPPIWGAGLRFLVAAILVIAIMVALRQAIPRGGALTGALLYGLFQFGGAFGLYHYPLVRVHAGFGQTVLALVPLATLLLAVVLRQERLRAAAVVGTLLGLAGVVLISRDPLRESVPLLSVFALLGSVLCFAEAAVLVRRIPQSHPVAMNAVGMAVSTLVLVGASLILGESLTFPHSVATWVALGYVSAVGAKATGGAEIAADSIDHLRRYIEMLFGVGTKQAKHLTEGDSQ